MNLIDDTSIPRMCSQTWSLKGASPDRLGTLRPRTQFHARLLAEVPGSGNHGVGYEITPHSPWQAYR